MNKQELLQTLETTHGEFLQAINQFSDADMTTRHIVAEWTPKDVLAHVTRWEDICSGYLSQLAAGEPIPPLGGTTNEMNTRWNAEDSQLTLEQVWENSDQSALRVRAMVESLEDDWLDRKMRGPWPEITEELPLSRIIAIDTWDHYQQHIKDIAQATGKKT